MFIWAAWLEFSDVNLVLKETRFFLFSLVLISGKTWEKTGIIEKGFDFLDVRGLN